MWIVAVNTKYYPYVKEFDTYRDALKYYKLIDEHYLVSNQIATELEGKYIAKVSKFKLEEERK